jgi:hypothetical protein
MTLIQQTLRSSDFELALITPIAFIALLPSGEGFREVYNFATDILAIKHLIWFARLQHMQDTDAVRVEIERGEETQDFAALSMAEVDELVGEQDVWAIKQSMHVEAAN